MGIDMVAKTRYNLNNYKVVLQRKATKMQNQKNIKKVWSEADELAWEEAERERAHQEFLEEEDVIWEALVEESAKKISKKVVNELV